MNNITINDLGKMADKEGLILQGCGGDPQEWLDGINEMLTEEKILINGDVFKNASVFEHKDTTNILFHMDNVKLDIGKLAMWRLRSHSSFGGTWLSDYIENNNIKIQPQELQEKMKPKCAIIGTDGNIFKLMGLAANTLREHGLSEQAQEMRERITKSGDYSQALGIIMDYIDPISVSELYEGNEEYEYDEDYDEDCDQTMDW